MIQGSTFREAAGRAECLSISDLLRLHGRASLAGLLLVFSVLSMIPLAGAGTALSLPLFAVALHWPGSVRQPAGSKVSVPTRLLEMRIGASWTRRCLHLFATIYDTARARMRRRWLGLRHPRTALFWRVWIAAMAFVILLPLPFGNLLPGVSLVLLGLGWIFKDGVALTLSLASGAAALGYLLMSVQLLQAMVRSVVSWWA